MGSLSDSLFQTGIPAPGAGFFLQHWETGAFFQPFWGNFALLPIHFACFNLLNFIKNSIPHRLKVQYHILKMNLKGNPIYRIEDYPTGKKIYLFLAADYGNLGDVALTLAEIKFLNQHFPDYHVVEIIIRNVVEGIHFAKKHIQKEDMVSIVGGGNLGTLYPGLEMFRQIIIETFPHNKIISFPQSIHFPNDDLGRKALEKCKSVYSRHKDLILVAREQKSFDFLKTHFTKNQVLLTPDIVFSQDETQPHFQRNGVLLSLRRDIEKNLSEEESELIKDVLHHHFKEIKYYDTNINRPYLNFEEKTRELNKIWEAYKQSELVVTDRLHGMIFCYITDTPCLAFLNNNHKIESSYDWIRFSKSIALIRNCTREEIEKAIDGIRNRPIESQYQNLNHRFQPLIDAIRKGPME